MESVSKCNKNSRYNVAFISPYKYMAELFKKIAEENDVKAYVEIASLNDAAKIADKLKDKVDIFLSRGGIAEYIKASVNTPVVSIPVTAFDIIRSMYVAKKITDNVALFTYKKNIIGIKDMENILQIKIREYTFLSESDIHHYMKEIKISEIKAIVGGMTSIRIAKIYGIKGILIECGEEAIQQSLEKALNIAEVRNSELERLVRLRFILNSITQGIIVTDEKDKIIVYNPVAEKILSIPSYDALGKNALDIISNTKLHNVFETGKAEVGDLQDINGGTIAINRIPIEVDGNRIGVVCTFEDVTKIQQLEQKIREKKYKKGFVAKYIFDDILTINIDVMELKKIANLYAKTDGAILIQGESGTGKELFAQSIHNASQRSYGPFVAINCAAIPDGPARK